MKVSFPPFFFLFFSFIFLGNDAYGNNSNEAVCVQWKIERENLKNEIEGINRKIGNWKFLYDLFFNIF